MSSRHWLRMIGILLLAISLFLGLWFLGDSHLVGDGASLALYYAVPFLLVFLWPRPWVILVSPIAHLIVLGIWESTHTGVSPWHDVGPGGWIAEIILFKILPLLACGGIALALSRLMGRRASGNQG